jgi:hypothetical protein
MGIKLSNNAFGTLAAGINSSATSITLTTGQGARFPTLGAGDYFYATLVDTSNNLEIVKCTARSTDVLTVVRAQESTTARAYNTGDRIEIRLTAQTFIDSTTVTPASVSDQANTSTGYFDVPTGTTAQRPGSPSTGMMRFNSTNGVYEFYNGSSWLNLVLPYNVEYLVIAGGGSGGVYSSGSGYSSGNQGSNSSFGVITATGGGAGTAYSDTTTRRDGGSGGGGGSSGGDNNLGGTRVNNQGYNGGDGVYSVGVYQGGGGGGAGAVGGNAGGGTAGSGGNGLSNSITGTAVTRAGGGGGGVFGGGTGGSGGTGGGGAGNGNGSISGIAGTVNTGSGGGAGNTVGAGHGGGGAGGYRTSVIGATSGGGGAAEATLQVTPAGSYTVVVGAGGAAVGVSTTSGAGGSGVVIIRYEGTQRGTGGTVTSSGGYTIHTFTSSGTYVA